MTPVTVDPATPTAASERCPTAAGSLSGSPAMRVDEATLRDLEAVWTSTPRGTSLLELVDRTRTCAGREQLRHRLEGPACSGESILSLQRAHQQLAANSDLYRALIDKADPDATARYIRSRWQLPDARHGLARLADGFWRGGWRADYFREVRDGQAHVLALLQAAADLRPHLEATATSALHSLAAEFTGLLERTELRDAMRYCRRHSAGALLSFDQLARHDAKLLIESVIRGVGDTEAMWSLGVAAAEHGWRYPVPSSRFEVRGLRHPFLGPLAVPNDLSLGEDVRICFVTGPNMAGKSTFLKAIALGLLLAHVGCGVPADSLAFRPVGTLFSSVRVSDSLHAGESLYLAEVRRVRALAQSLCETGSAVAVLDEPLRGTNVHDAAEATLAIVTRLAEHSGALVFVASHLGEIAPAIASDARFSLLHFAADLSENEPHFDYRIRNGVSDQRLGMTLLRQEGVLQMLERAAVASRDVAGDAGAGDRVPDRRGRS